MVVESNFSTVYNGCSIQRFETFLFYSETHGKRFHKLKHKSVFFLQEKESDWKMILS